MKPECILIRIGEQSLKSDQVRKIFDRILVRNIDASLKGLKYQMKKEPNRYFIYTKDIDKCTERLKIVFGITSLSPCYTCPSNMEDIKNLSKKLFKVPKGKTFAIRARRSGNQKFTSVDIGREVGYIITGKADLNNPDKELFIECRERETYLFTEKIPGPGGLPLGASGKIFGILKDKEDFVACWMLMKRGCEIVAISDKKPLIAKLKKWHIGRELKTFAKIPKDHDISGIVVGEKTYKTLKKTDILILRPLVALNPLEITKNIG